MMGRAVSRLVAPGSTVMRYSSAGGGQSSLESINHTFTDRLAAESDTDTHGLSTLMFKSAMVATNSAFGSIMMRWQVLARFLPHTETPTTLAL